MRGFLLETGKKAALAVGGLACLSFGYWGGYAVISANTETSQKSDVSTVTTEPAAPTATTSAPVDPVPEPGAVPPVGDTSSTVVEVVPAPAPEPAPAPAPQLPADGSLPEGWLPPSVPGGPPTAPAAPLPPAPCMPGEGGERCAPSGG